MFAKWKRLFLLFMLLLIPVGCKKDVEHVKETVKEPVTEVKDENKEQMERKIHYVELSWEMEEWEKNFSEEKVERWMEDNQKKNFVEKLLECVGGESDICIIEDFT